METINGSISGGIDGRESHPFFNSLPASLVTIRRPQPPPDLFHLRVVGPVSDEMAAVLTPEALLFLEELESRFGSSRRELLVRRRERAERIELGEDPEFLAETKGVRESTWRVADVPHDLQDRRVEITGPAEAKMMINALNSGAKVFMADLEDALSPTWENLILGQAALSAAVRRTLSFRSNDGRVYHLNERLATLKVRPRGWHMNEKHLRYDGEPMSASLVDFGLFFFHNAKELIARGSGPYFYLPKMESHLEARLWNDIFVFAQKRMGIPVGTIRATVLIETILAAFEMDEILFELREHAAGLNAGRWDYLFSIIKKFAHSDAVIFPDRAQLTMTVPFMRAYTQALVATCHRRGAHAIGGMAAFIPSRKNAEVNRVALEKVREDKLRESVDGFDGTWVAHPDLVPVASKIFSERLGMRPHQKDQIPSTGLTTQPRELLPRPVPGGQVTSAGVDANLDVAIQYISAWLQGQGAVAIHGLMEDAATAEIARAELWQWVRFGITTADGVKLTREEFSRRLERERAQFAGQAERGRVSEACDLLERLVLSERFEEFLTTPAYGILEKRPNPIFALHI